MPIRYISKGKGKKRRVIPIRPMKGVSVRSVSLQPTVIGKINKEQISLLNRGESATFSKALNKIVIRAKRDHIHKFDQLDYEDGIELGHCEICGGWFDTSTSEREIIPDHDLGDIVMISPDNDNEGYEKFRGKKLRIVHVATNRDEHRGFDESVGQALYDLETINGQQVGFSLYDYELVSA